MRRITLKPGEERAYDEAEWTDSLVLVDQGAVELETLRGNRWLVRTSAVLWLVGLPLWALHNPGAEPAVLVAISRRRTRSDDFSPRPQFQRSDGC